MLGFSGIAQRFFGSANERKLRPFQARVAEINALEPKFAAMNVRTAARADARHSRSDWPRARRSKTSYPKPSRSCAKPPSARSASGISTSS